MTDLLYPETSPYDSGWLSVPPHRIYYEQYGNPSGEPVLLVHGGPGAPFGPEGAQFFDPQRFRIINYHQRGAGKSQPFLSLDDNTTQHLIADIVLLRQALKIEGPMHLFGGSWGSFLMLMYALNHPATVASVTMRGIFLGRSVDIFNSYQRDAERTVADYLGSARTFPEEWEAFRSFIPPQERGGILQAYTRRIHFSNPEQLEAARRWYAWEDRIMNLKPSSREKLQASLQKVEDVMAQAVLETHYFSHDCFLSDFGGDGFILRHLDLLNDVQITIVQGRYDQCTPRSMADELVTGLNEARRRAGRSPVTYVVTVAGHTQADEENQAALIAAVKGLTPIFEPAGAA